MSLADLDESVLLRLKEMIGDAKAEQLGELFRQNVRTRLAAASDQTIDRYELSVAFHSIKGSAQLVGALRLEAAAAAWEKKAQAGETESVEGALTELAEAFKRVEEKLIALAGSD